jgi:hypothetical protein
MLLLGPPQMAIEVVPFMESVFEFVGSVMSIGTGATTETIPAVAVAVTLVAVGPNKRIRVVFTLRETET